MAEITPADVDFLMQEAVRNFADRKQAERAAQPGDEVQLNYEAKDLDGIVQMAGKAEAFVLGAGTLFPEFEQALLGHGVGEEIATQCSVPSDYFIPALKGKTLNLKASILQVNELTLPPVDDNLAVKALGEGKTLADLSQVLEEELKFQREDRMAQELINEFFDKLFEATKTQVTQEQIDEEFTKLMKSPQSESYDDAFKSQLKVLAHRNVTLRMAMEEILKQPEFQVKDEELVAIFEAEIAEKTPEEQVKIREELQKNPIHFADMRRRLQMQKLYEFIES